MQIDLPEIISQEWEKIIREHVKKVLKLELRKKEDKINRSVKNYIDQSILQMFDEPNNPELKFGEQIPYVDDNCNFEEWIRDQVIPKDMSDRCEEPIRNGTLISGYVTETKDTYGVRFSDVYLNDDNSCDEAANKIKRMSVGGTASDKEFSCGINYSSPTWKRLLMEDKIANMSYGKTKYPDGIPAPEIKTRPVMSWQENTIGTFCDDIEECENPEYVNEEDYLEAYSAKRKLDELADMQKTHASRGSRSMEKAFKIAENQCAKPACGSDAKCAKPLTADYEMKPRQSKSECEYVIVAPTDSNVRTPLTPAEIRASINTPHSAETVRFHADKYSDVAAYVGLKRPKK